jgi:predicted nuclease with RNAse H fold
MAQGDSQKLGNGIHLVFRPQSEPRLRVWVDAFDHEAKFRNEDSELRSFRIRLVPPEVFPTSVWIVNESVHGERTKYTPSFLEYAPRGTEDPGQEQRVNPRIAGLQDPGLTDMEKTAQILEECWQLYSAGDIDAVHFWGAKT